MKTLRRIGGLVRPYRGRVATALLLTTLVCLLNLPTPYLVQALVDGAPTAGAGVIAGYGLALLAVFAAQAAAGYAAARVTGGVGLGVVRDLRHGLYDRLQRVGLAYYDRTPAGAILSRLMDDVAAVQGLITTQSLSALTDLGTAAVAAAWLLAQSRTLFLAVVAFLPVHVLVFRAYTRRIRAGTAAVRVELDGIFGRLKEKIDGALVVRACAREDAEVRGFAAQIGAAHRSRLTVGRWTAAFSILSGAAGGVGAAAVFAAGAWEAAHGRLTPGGVVSASALAALLFGPVGRLSDLAAVFEQAAAGLDRLGDVLDLAPDAPEPADPLPVGRPRGRVEFDRVGFGYRPGRPVLWDVRLRVEPGLKVALVGPTGCGKSTLLQLLLRFYDPTWGEIRLDGAPLRRLRPADLRRHIGVVPQEPVVFRASLADNIRYGCPDADAAQVEAAARAARVCDFVARLPGGYSALVGEGGCKLSQGERQRVAVARAFCKDPALVVMDEATSSLDAANETLVQAALADLLRGRTAFVIAHRLATVVDADLIVVMEGGLVVQKGRHEELIEDKEGLYYQLYRRQSGGEPPPRRPARRPERTAA